MSVQEYVELEIGLHRLDRGHWTLEMRAMGPKADFDVMAQTDGPSPDVDALERDQLDDEAYGHRLTQALFGLPEVRQAYEKSKSASESLDIPLRLRLFIAPKAGDLHDLRWETLQDPADGTPLLTREQVLFSRYLSSLDWRPVGVRPESQVQALVAIANPTDVERYGSGGRPLAPVAVEDELKRAQQALQHTRMVALAGTPHRATLQNIVAALRDGCDILYLVCHGYLSRQGPQLLLETDEGALDRVPGHALVQKIREMRVPPRLVVLASCQSAGTGQTRHSVDQGALASIGPLLAEAGVPAVVAMQDNVTMQTMGAFLPVFFKELHRDGQIDRAMAVARSSVRDRRDWWVPVLYMRLKSGRLWYKPGFADDAFGKWPSLVADVREGRCTPILGPGLTDGLLGTRQELAWHWASKYRFPMAPHHQEDLPHVAQFLAVDQNDRFPRIGLREYLQQELLERYGDVLPDDLRNQPLDKLFPAVGAHLRAINPSEPHTMLAGLQIPVYVTTHPTDLLAEALRAAGKQPRVEFCRWNPDVSSPPPLEEREPNYEPSVADPMVFHLFGRLEHPRSLVLTEDDYFDYLIGVMSDPNAIPPVVRRFLTDASLIFLGFRLDEWDFRVLFRSLENQEGRGRRRQYTHVAAQIDPEESRTLNPDRARRYLASYFQDSAITIYWGSAENFLETLAASMRVPA